MSVACLRAARMGRESELSDAVGNCSVCDFVREVFLHVRLALAAAVNRMSCSWAEMSEQMNLSATLSNVS